MKIERISRIFLFASLLMMGSQSASAQDLLARQTPIDRKVKVLDTLMLRKFSQDNEFDALFDTQEWGNERVHNRQAQLPESYKINLRNFCMPTTSRVVTSNFGARWGRRHEGLDIKVYTGDTIRAAFSGKVRVVKYNRGGYGKYVVIRHSNGLETVYGHLSKQLVIENQEVRAGDVIGLGGNTGRSYGSHLHFETLLNGIPINPALLFDFRAQDVTADVYTFRRNTYASESEEATRLRGKQGNGSYTPEEVRGVAIPTLKPAKEQQTASVERKFHKVKKGETLSAIARKYGVNLKSIYRLNNFNAKTKIKPGNMVRYR